MKFNHRELALYASTKLGKADKEGCLWMKENEGKVKKKQNGITAINLSRVLMTAN